jgi:DNA-binding response OmpR family regulator
VSNKILLLEDDSLLAESLMDLLEDDFDVLHAINGEVALDMVYNEKFDLYLFDINVPLIDGISLLKELRHANDLTPAIFLTSYKDKDKLKEGFLSGGDDYITKPFDTDELLLRLHAVLKRVKPSDVFKVGDFIINPKNMLITYKNEELRLSKKEFELLSLFLTNVNKPLSKETIIEELWQLNESGSDGALRVYINRLKHLIPDLKIENLRGIGYKLVL